MAMTKYLLLLFTFLILLSPASPVIAQETYADSVSQAAQTEEAINAEKKKDKTKKDDIEINWTFFISLLINVVTVLIIVRFIYYPNYHKQDVFFTYFLFNLAIFILTFLLNQIKISIGAAFGLFAVFSMLRYRTEGISMKDMTYLFVVIAVGLVSAVQLEYYELAIINSLFILGVFVLDSNIFMRREYSKIINYENIELIKVSNHKLLLEDLRTRTGLDIHKVTVVKIDFLRDSATLMVYYYLPRKQDGDTTQPNVVFMDQDID
jgi:hypothetical protein